MITVVFSIQGKAQMLKIESLNVYFFHKAKWFRFYPQSLDLPNIFKPSEQDLKELSACKNDDEMLSCIMKELQSSPYCKVESVER